MIYCFCFCFSRVKVKWRRFGLTGNPEAHKLKNVTVYDRPKSIAVYFHFIIINYQVYICNCLLGINKLCTSTTRPYLIYGIKNDYNTIYMQEKVYRYIVMLIMPQTHVSRNFDPYNLKCNM